MQPVSTEYPGLPRAPARHLKPTGTRRSAPPRGLLCALVLGLGGCANEPADTTGGQSTGSALDTPPPLLSDPAAAVPGTVPATAPALDVTLQGDRLRLDWRLGPAPPGDGTRLHLELVDPRDPERRIDELRPALTGTARQGNALLTVRAHDLAWHAVALRARWTDATGRTLATSRARALAPLLDARTQRIDPDTPDARFGTALAYGTEGAVLVIADPANGSLLLHPTRGDGSLNGAQRVPVAGLATARPGTLRLRASAYADVLALSWRDADSVPILTVLASGDDGPHRTVWRQRLAAPVRDLVLAARGRRLDLVDAAGHHRRLLRTATRWREDPDPDRAVFDALAVDPAGEPVGLVTTPDGAALLRDGRQQRALPGTVGLLERSVAQATRVRLDPDGLHLAIATLEHREPAPLPDPSATPARAVPTLRLFSRTDPAQPWRAGPTLRRAATTGDARTTLQFGTRPAARSDTLLWHWHRPQDGLAAPRTADMDGMDGAANPAPAPNVQEGMPAGVVPASGLAILTTRPAAQAFGDADRTDRGAGAWRVAFSLPDDGTNPGASFSPRAATLSAHGTALAFTRGSSPAAVVLID